MIPKQKDYANDVIKYADKGDLKKLRKAIEKDPLLVTKFDDHALSPLHYAAAAGSVECVDLLLINGAKANSNARYGEATALHSALLAKQEGTALLLLKHGANPETVYQTKSGFMLSSEMGKRFELEFRETAKKNSHKVNTSPMVPQSPRQNTTTTTQQASAATVPPDSPVSYAPPKPVPAPTNQPGLKRQVSIPTEMKPISPADAVQQAMDMLGMGTPQTMDSFQSEKEKESLQFQKLSSSQALQAKMTERKSVLERRMHKCDAIINALEPFNDVTDMSTPDVRSAVTALGFTLEPVTAAKPAARSVVRRKKAGVLQKKAQAAAAEQPAPQAAGVSPRPSEPLATGRMTHRPPAVAVNSKQINPDSAAQAIICHFKSWFDPSVSDAVLPAWYPPVSKEAPAANAGAAGGQRQGPVGAPISPTSPSQGGTTPTAAGPMVPLADVMLDWAKHLCYMPILTKDFDFQRLRDKEIRNYVEEFREYHLALASQVNMQQEILGDSFRETKNCVDSLRDRVINLLDQYYTVALRHEDPAILLLAYMMIVGASYFTFQAMFSTEQAAIVANTKEFVSAILNLGKVDDGELLAAFSCMKLNAVVNALVFRTSSPQVAKDLSFHNATIALTARAMVMDAKQGNPRRNDYNVSIGSHLSKMKDLVRGAARSHRGDQLPVKEDTHVLDMSTKYLTQVLMFYKSQVASDEDGKVLLAEIEKIIPMITKFCDLYIHSREVTLYSWVDVLQAAMDIGDAVCRFCDETVSCLDDPDGFFDAAILIAKQYVLQIILAITCLAAENPVCPRHHITFSLRALCIHLVNFMDLYYLTA